MYKGAITMDIFLLMILVQEGLLMSSHRERKIETILIFSIHFESPRLPGE